jgi:hypothetical protein
MKDIDDIELEDALEGEILYPNLPCKKEFGEAVVLLKNVSKGSSAANYFCSPSFSRSLG